MDKYNPEQFKIIGGFAGSKLENKVKDGYVPSTDTPYIDKKTKKIKYWNGPTINKKTQYYRIIIQKKQVKKWWRLNSKIEKYADDFKEFNDK